MRARQRADDFIKAYYFDQPQDLFAWMKKNQGVFDAGHFGALFETGMMESKTRREFKLEFDRLVAGLT
jgi:hypothetical protein